MKNGGIGEAFRKEEKLHFSEFNSLLRYLNLYMHCKNMLLEVKT